MNERSPKDRREAVRREAVRRKKERRAASAAPDVPKRTPAVRRARKTRRYHDRRRP